MMSGSGSPATSASSGSTRKPRQQKRLSGSCDVCRMRKVKCDSQNFSDGQCTTCRTHEVPCTHEIPTKRPGVRKFSRQLTQLQDRVKELEGLLEQKSAPTPPMQSHDPVADLTATHEHPATVESDQTDLDYIKMVNDMKRFSVTEHTFMDRFFGPSSNIYFIRQVMSMPGLPNAKGPSIKCMHEWEAETVAKPTLIFPDYDLLQTLIGLYFKHCPTYLCAIHEPSFRRDVAAGKHLVDHSFGGVVLMVCAIASRASDDPRVLLDGTDAQHSSGWKYVVQTRLFHSLFDVLRIHDIQYCCLLTEYMMGSSSPQITWQIVGVGIRYAIELGLHRRRKDKVTVESELQKRVFWTIFMLDRGLSLFYGRPLGIADDEYDIDYPLLVDDEYWETGDPATDFKQPKGVPSRMEGFVSMIKLNQIASFALRTIFNGVRKSKAASNDANWIQNHVTLLDSMLNSWYESVPAHLTWDTSSGSRPTAFIEQSSEVYMMYYNLQLFVHRPFLFTTSSLALPSLAICTNAARSCVRLVNVREEHKITLSTMTNVTIFAAGSVVLTNMWRTFQSGRPLTQRDINDLESSRRALQGWTVKFHVCMYFLKILEALSTGLPLNNDIISIALSTAHNRCDLPHYIDPGAISTHSHSHSHSQSPSQFNSIPSGYAPHPHAVVPVPTVPFDLGMNMDFFTEWSGYTQPEADMSLLGDMSSWMQETSQPAAESRIGFDGFANWNGLNGFMGNDFFTDGMETGPF